MTNSQERLLITGASGKLGEALSPVFPKALTPSKQVFDVLSKTNVFSFVKKQRPRAIIHLAALTDINLCESNKRKAWDVNVVGTLNVVKACEKYAKDCYFVFMSSPGVFAGDTGNYNENSIPNPKNFYGITKLAGELIVNSSSLQTLIIRSNFIQRNKWPYKKAFSDRYGTYLFVDQLATAIKEVMAKKLTGIVHITSTKKMSLLEAARIINPHVKSTTMTGYSGAPLSIDLSLTSIRWKKYPFG